MNNNVPNNNGNNDNGLNAVSLGSIDIGASIPPVDNNSQPNMSEGNQAGSSLNVGSEVSPTPITVPPVEDITPTVPPVEPVSSDSISSVPPVDVSPQPIETPVQPVEPVIETSTMETDNVGETAEPIAPPVAPEIDPVPEPVEPVSTADYDIPQTIDTNTPPIFNEIGTVPPIDGGPIPVPNMDMNTNIPVPKEKKKGGMNKLIFVLIVVLLIAAVGVGVYIFLSMSNSGTTSVSVTPKEVQIEVGSEVSTNIDDYADFVGVDSSTCSLDTSNITDTSTLNSEYTFTIVCNDVSYEGTATVVDTVAPEVELSSVTVQVGSSVEPEDFISSCEDATTCSYEFEDASLVATYLTTAANYHVNIVVKDEAGNEVVVEGTLVVTEEEIPETSELYMACSLAGTKYSLGLVGGEFDGNAIIEYTFTLTASEYTDFKALYGSSASASYNGMSGIPSFDDSTYTVTLTQHTTMSDVESVLGTDLADTYGGVLTYFNNLGYECSLEQP